MATVSSLWRYPIKAIGREEVDEAQFTAGMTMPGDRIWAVAHQKSKATNTEWARCSNFLRGCSAPTLQAVTLSTGSTGAVTLEHPKVPALTVDPDQDPSALLTWLGGLLQGDGLQPHAVIKVPGRGMTDADFPSVTLCNLSSHKSVEGRAGLGLSIHRWRGNIWLDGLAPWEEFDWIGKEVRIGGAVFRIMERTGRCKMTTVNPETGQRDIDTLSVLRDYGHTDFSVQADVVQTGLVKRGDEVNVL